MLPSTNVLCVSSCRSRVSCGDTGISSVCSSPVRSPTLTSSARPPTWRLRSRRSTAAIASKATPSTWTARATRTYSDQTALLCEGGPWWCFDFPKDVTKVDVSIFLEFNYLTNFSFFQSLSPKHIFLFLTFFSPQILPKHTAIETKDCFLHMQLQHKELKLFWSCGINLKIPRWTRSCSVANGLAKREVVFFFSGHFENIDAFKK